MNAGLTTSSETHRRRRKTKVSGRHSVADLSMISLLALLPVIVIWVLGGNRFWIMGPMIMLVLITAIIFAVRYLYSINRNELVVPPAGILLLAYLGYLAALVSWAEIPYESWLEIFRYISYVAAYWMWTNILRINNRWKWVMTLLMLSVSIMAWYALIQHVHGSAKVLFVDRPVQYGMRASGSYICPNHFANLIEMIVPICIGVAFCRSAGVALRLIAGYTALICLPALYLTDSRSGWIGLAVGLVVCAISISMRKGIRRFLLVLIVAPMLVGAAGVAIWKLSPRVQARVEAAVQGDVRIPLWKDSLEMAKEYPWFGSGLGSYRWMYPHFRQHYKDYANPEFAHNDFLHFWVETGAVGVGLMALVVALIMLRAVRIILRDQDGPHTFLMGGMLGAMAGALAHAFFDFNFHIFANTHVFVFLVASMVAATQNKEVDRVLEVHHPSARWIGAGLVVLLVMLLVLYAKSVVSYGYAFTAKSRMEKIDWDRAQDEYKKALFWSPGNWRAQVELANLLRTRVFWMRHQETRKKWMGEAHHHYEQAMVKNPWEADVLYGLGSLFKLEGNQAAALEMRWNTVRKVPRHVFYLNELGLQLKDMGQYNEALEVFRQSKSVKSSPVAELNIQWLQKKIASAP